MLTPNKLNRDREGAPGTYLITWACYGTWLPGQCGSISRTNNRFGAPIPEANAEREQRSRDRMVQQAYLLDSVRRQIVLKSLYEVSCHRGWTLLAAHVRTNHIHVVITGNCKPEKILVTMKAYSSRALNKCEIDDPDRSRWARHGSTRYLWTQDAVRAAIRRARRADGHV
jgi:REP element-mobilizing transposase RayT